MFGTLLGGLPRPLEADGRAIEDDDAAVVAVIEAQAKAGLEPLTDGRLRWHGPLGAIAGLDGVVVRTMAGSELPELERASLPSWRRPLTVAAWQFARDLGAGFVKQALPGPYTLGRRLGEGDRDGVTAAFADALHREIDALADAGCGFVEIEEADAHLVGTDEVERRRFRDAHERLLRGITGAHLSLSIVGGNADTAGIATILGAPYASLAVDLIEGPDNWRLVTATPGDRGIVCGAVSTLDSLGEGPELLLWAAAYAASTNARGRDRVGIGTAGGLEGRSWSEALRAMTRLGSAAGLSRRPGREVAEAIDPRALDLRSAALGRYMPPDRSRRRQHRRPGPSDPSA